MADILREYQESALANQSMLPFTAEPKIESVLSLDDSAILEGSLAVEGFNWDGLTGEVFEDGGVCFHDGTEYDISRFLSEKQYISSEVALAMVKIAHDIKKGRLTVDERE